METSITEQDLKLLTQKVRNMSSKEDVLPGLFKTVIEGHLTLGSKIQDAKKQINPITGHIAWKRLSDLYSQLAFQFNKISEYLNQYNYDLDSSDDLITPGRISHMDISQVGRQLEFILILQNSISSLNPLTATTAFPRTIEMIDQEIDAMYLQANYLYNVQIVNEEEGEEEWA